MCYVLFQKCSEVLRRKEIKKNRAEMNKIETRKTTEKLNKSKSWFLEEINKIAPPLARLRKKERRCNKIRNERGHCTNDITEIQRIISDGYE